MRRSKPPSTLRRSRRWMRRGIVVVAGVAVVLLGLRLALPGYLLSYVNRTLDQSPDYDGRVGGIDIHLWRGAYRIHDIQIVKTTHSVPVPFFAGKQVDFSLDWKSLFHGHA